MTDTTQFPQRLCSNITVTILDGETISSAASIHGTSLQSIDVPAGLEGTSLSFLVSTNGTDYIQYRRMLDGTVVSGVIGSSGAYAAGAFDFSGYNHIKLVVAVQTGDITITLKTRPL